MDIASYIDHTLLKPAITYIEIKKICEEAVQYGFAAVCVPPTLARQAGDYLTGSSVSLATVIGFPLGYSVTGAKTAEIEQAIADQVDELDIVINLVHLKNGQWPLLEKEMKELSSIAHGHGKLVKVIIESGLLTDEEIIRCCEMYSGLGADFLKTSTGYAEKGASIEAVRLMKNHLPDAVKIKASGGIRDYDFAQQLILAGASRLGCSASVAIVKGALSAKNA
jgi:deoxyribose-phosphate aldolase